MTTSEYVLNAAFVAVVLVQARERRIDLRSLVLPLAALAFVAHAFIHSVPTSRGDLELILALALVGASLGLICGLATHVRFVDGSAYARVGWLAGILLAAGIGSRIAFAFAVTHGGASTVRSFSIAHHIGAAAWPVALVSMAILEVSIRLGIVHLRGRRSIVFAQ